MAACVIGGLLSGCHHGAADPPEAAQAEPASSGETGYTAPPRVVSAQRLDGGVVLSGRSDPNVRVRLSSPDGAAFGATADAAGSWTLTVPPMDGVRLYGLSEVMGGRAVQGGGYLAVLPAPGPAAALLRAGGGSEALGQAAGAPSITAVDFDASGAAVVSGLAKPGAAVRLIIDNAVAGDARPDGAGRFSIPLAAVLKRGDHAAQAQSSGGQSRLDFVLSPPAAISGGPYRGERRPGGWRIDWLTPGGSAQTTLVIDPATEPQRP